MTALSNGNSINSPTHLITLYDSNLSKTISIAGNRPSNDSGDAYVGFDTGVNGTLGVSMGAPASISDYINNVGDGSSWLERLTSSAKIFNVPVTLAPGSGIKISNLLTSPAAPSVISGFNGGSVSSANVNGTAVFQVNIGTGTAGNIGTVALSTAAHGWACLARNQNRPADIEQTGSTTTSAILANYGKTLTLTNWTNSDVLNVMCLAY